MNSHQKTQNVRFFSTPVNETKFLKLVSVPSLLSLFLVQTFLCGDSRSDQCHFAKMKGIWKVGKKQQLVLLIVENRVNTG